MAVHMVTHYGMEGPSLNSSDSMRFSLLYTLPDQPWSPSSLLYSGYQGSFQEKRSGGVINHLPASTDNVMCEYSYTCTPLLCLQDIIQGDLYIKALQIIGLLPTLKANTYINIPL